MRWVVLTDDFPPGSGGVATWTARVVDGLAERGHDVRVFARAREGLVASKGVTPVRGPSFGRHGGTWLGLRALPAVLEADRVLATTWPVATLVSRLGVRLDLVAHGSDVTGRDPDRRVWRAADRRWAVSTFLAERLGEQAVRVLPAPVPLAASPARPGSGLRWGLVARAVPGKGGERFLRLVAAARAQGTVIGGGPELARWRGLAERLGARVTFTGPVPHERVAGLVRDLDLVALLPEHPEGLGLALVEAAAQGVATVGCRSGGVPEAVGPGLLLDDPDDPVRSAEQLTSWWTPERGAAAWAWCRATHGITRTVDALADPR